jgi:transposase-like protein
VEEKGMRKARRQHSAEFKFRVALEAATGLKTISELASEHAIHPNLVRQWKSELMEKGSGVFGGAQDEQRQTREQAAREMELYEQIGRLKMDLEWVKKKAARFG